MFLLDDDFKRLGKGKHTQNFWLCKHFSEIFRKTVFIQPFWLSHCKDIHGCTKYRDEIADLTLWKRFETMDDFLVRKIKDRLSDFRTLLRWSGRTWCACANFISSWHGMKFCVMSNTERASLPCNSAKNSLPVREVPQERLALLQDFWNMFLLTTM